MRPFRPAPFRPALSLSVVSCLALVAACGGGPAGSSSDGSRAAGYPVTAASCGGKVTVDDRPERIVSLNQGTTEILLSLGVADRMVGTATWTDPVLPSLAGANRRVDRLSDDYPSLEAVLDRDPDLVTASFTSTLAKGGVAPRTTFEKFGVPAYLSPAECGKVEDGSSDGVRTGTLTIDTIYREVRELAALVDAKPAGERLVERLERRMDRASKAAKGPGGEPVSVAYWFANAESPYLAGCCGGPGITTRALGLRNVFADSKAEWPQVSWEVVADRDPDVLVIGDLTRRSQTAETARAKIAYLEKNPVTREMTAVRKKRYVVLAGADLNPSIRTVDATEKVRAGLRDLGLVD
ncbi:MAG: ABC transporter substrate-binding protein [Aeromicrobium erythreum]